MTTDGGGDYHTRLVGAVAQALSFLLEPGEFDAAMQRALKRIGQAAEADRMYVFEKHLSLTRHEFVMSQHYEWARETVTAQIANQDLQDLPFREMPHLLEKLAAGDPYYGVTRELSPEAQALLVPQQILSLAIMPIILRGELWGFVGLDDCHRERRWSEPELQSLRVAAAGLGGSIVRRQVEASFRTQTDELKRHQMVALSLAEDARLSEQEAARANLAKTTFLAMMSHEIRTPLNGVIGFTELLLAEGLPERQTDLAQAIKTCGETLLVLISDILDISKIESGKLEFSPFDADVETCVRSTLTTFEPAAQKKGLELHLDWDQTVPKWLWLDLNRFRQVLFNLLGNAVKFTKAGRIDVRVWAEPTMYDRVRLHCVVQDTGLGIDPGELRSIFEPFRQGEAAHSSAVGGSGLGLAICRRLVEGMGGQIYAESVPGSGSKFTFFIETQKGRAVEDVDPVTETATGAEPAAARILVVDDVATNIRLLVAMLSRLGIKADSVNGGREAVERVHREDYDLIFMDIFMPELDGFGVTREIRSFEHGRRRHTWIVAVTADVLPENRQNCAEAGMDDFLTKPLRIKDLESALRHWRAGKPVLHD